MNEIKSKGILWVDKMLRSKMTYTNPGSISHLLYCRKPSEQSINIKMGKFGEFLAKEIIALNSNFELLTCGVQQINETNGKKKDIDLLFKDINNKIIYYRELKGNIELDTEKIPATINKCREIEQYLQSKFKDENYKIDYAILNWSVYNRNILTKGLSNIKSFEKNDIKIEHFKDFCHILNIDWSEEDFYDYFKQIGIIISNSFN